MRGAVMRASKAENAVILISRLRSRGEDIIHGANFGADIAVDTRIFNAKLLVIFHKIGTIKISKL